MNAEIISVGTELLLGQILDTHAPAMARILADCGISCTHRQTVGDNRERLLQVLQQALGRADIVVTIGGLGPTADDLTRDAIASALGDELRRDHDMEEKLRNIFRLRNLTWVDSNLRQAECPTCGEFIDNPNGTAPGLICQKDGKHVIALPGPRPEFVPMAEGPVREYLMHLQPGQVIHSRTLRVCGMGESAVEDRIADLLESSNPTVAPYAHTAEVHLRLTARAESREAADRLIDPLHHAIAERLGNAIYGTDETTLEEAVVQLLSKSNLTTAVAESMTGGGLGERLTNVAGAGDAFLGGVITYDVSVKTKLLDVDQELVKEFGPVSSQCAEAMAVNVREKVGANFGISITGNAGPTSDVDGKPVGLTFIGIAGADKVGASEFRFRGSREQIRARATQAALVLLRENLLS
jgi:nicotinamide-nucleotide amidase